MCIGFHTSSQFSWSRREWGKNVDDRSFMHVDDKKVILVIGDSLTQGLDDTTITSKA